MEPAIGLGVYTLSEAARLMRAREATLRHWFCGDRRHSRFLVPDYQTVGGQQTISFLDLIDAVVLARLRGMGFSLQYLRRVYKAVRARVDHKHAFAHRELCVNGGEILLLESEHAQDHDKARLLDLMRPNQRVEPNLLAPTLGDITFGVTLADAWRPASGIIVDPKRNFGAPTIEGTGVAARVIFDAWESNGHSVEIVSDWYSIPTDRVHAAIEFMRGDRLALAA